MKILVCVKRVPDTASKLKVRQDGKDIEPVEEYVVSPYDEIAVEHAVQIKEKKSGTEVVIVCAGPVDAEKNMRNCLAMGGDRGILLETSSPLLDPFVIASALSETIRQEKPDLIFFGIKAVDGDNAQVGAMVATLCGYPFIDGAAGLEVSDSSIKARCEIEGSLQTLRSSLPCAVSISKGEVKEPRICSLINIRKARQKELKKVPCQLSAGAVKIEKMELPPQRKAGKIVGKGADAVPELFRLLREEAKIL